MTLHHFSLNFTPRNKRLSEVRQRINRGQLVTALRTLVPLVHAAAGAAELGARFVEVQPWS